MMRDISRVALALALALASLLAACGGPVNPDRPPKYDYEFDPPAGGEAAPVPSRI